MKRILCIILALTLLISCTACDRDKKKHSAANAKLSVHFIDVGQGDSILLESDDEFVLIDAGERDYGAKVLNYIEDQGADDLQYVIATHPHTDHFGGMRTVLENITAYNFITCQTDCETYSWTKLLKTVDKKNIRCLAAKPGDAYSFGNASFTILAPVSPDDENYNNCSVVVKVTCGDISFLLTGDAEIPGEQAMLSSGADLSADVLKCGHHGSSSSTGIDFLKAVQPEFAVVSCGENNDYGHPHKTTIYKMDAMGCTMLRTDKMGTIVAYTDGTTLSFSAENSDLSSYTYTAGQKHADTGALRYIGNRSSMIFHNPDCSGVASMNVKNKVEFNTRAEATGAGYTPCTYCNP